MILAEGSLNSFDFYTEQPLKCSTFSMYAKDLLVFDKGTFFQKITGT